MPKSNQPPTAVTPPAATAAAGPTLDDLLSHLLYMRQQLVKLDPDSLDPAQHEQWRTQVNAISLAITRVRNARLGELNDAFAAEVAALEAAADKLTDALYKLQTADEIIGTIADGMGIVTQILTLLP
jgi:hypothetical protein